MSNKFDALLEQLGTGKWNFVSIFAVAYWSAQVPHNAFGGAFLTPLIEHSCRIPPHGTPITTTNSDTNHTVIDACWYYENTTDGVDKLPCSDWDFDNTTYGSTLTSEFQLVCGNEFLRPTFQSLYFFGAVFGAVFNGWLADRYGRKTMLVFGSVSYSFLGNCINWLPNMSSILATRFIMGLAYPASVQNVYTLALEKCEQRYRSAVAILSILPWIFGMFAWGGYAYLIRDWRWLMFVAPLPSILFFPILWFVDESPRWLIVNRQHDRALQVLKRAARWNRATLPSENDLRALMKEIQRESCKGTEKIKDDNRGALAFMKDLANETIILVRTRAMRRITLCIYTTFAVSGLVYYGVSMSGGYLGSDPYLYMVLSGAMEVPGCTLTVPLVNFMGRRSSNIMCYFITSVALIALTFVPKGWLAMTMSLLSKVSISAAYQIVYLHATEVFPTEVRVRGLGTSSMASKIGSVSAPYLVDAVGSRYWWAPSVVCSGASMVAGLVCFFLPETLGMALPDTVAELEKTATIKKMKLRAQHQELEPMNQDEQLRLSD